MESVFNQTWKNLELIVVDDASDEPVKTVLADIASEVPLKIIRNSHPKGAAASRNIGFKHAEGEYVAGLDDDDSWHPERIERLMKAFQSNFAAVTANDLLDFGQKSIVWKKKAVITLNDLLYYNCVGNQVLTKKEYVQKAGGYDENLTAAQDYDLWIRLCQHFGPIKNVSFPLQTVSMESERKRITTSSKKLQGYGDCFEKHKEKMSIKQISYQKYRLRLAKGNSVTWLEMFRLVPLHLFVKEIKRKLFL